MDGNKDEAIKCLKIVKNAIESGDRTRAMKFLNKARRLDPSIEIDEFLSELYASQTEDKNTDEPASKKPFNPRPDGASASSSSSRTYTEEQVTVIREIERKKDYYEILGVEKKCSAEDIRKAYRKLSLKVHPDKNKAPGAEDSFKKVSQAFQCLSNEENRRKYDLVRSVYKRQGGGNANANGMRGFNADEIFRNFFSGGMPNSGGYTANSGRYTANSGGGYTANSGGYTPNSGGGYTANSGGYTPNSGGYTANSGGGYTANSGGYTPNSGGGYTANSGGYTANSGGYKANSGGGYTANSGGFPFDGPILRLVTGPNGERRWDPVSPQEEEYYRRGIEQCRRFFQHMKNNHQRRTNNSGQ